MNRSDLKVIIGGLDLKRRSERKRFLNAFVTNSRLMGVLVLYLHWELESYYSTDGDDRSFHQFFYIETTEEGIESYRSFYGNDAAALLEIEQTLLGGLGADRIDITEREARLLLQEYVDYNKRFDTPLPEGFEECDFLLRDPIIANPQEKEDLFQKTCVPLDNNYQMIHYFLMRYFAGDADAVRILSTDAIADSLSSKDYNDTLCLNQIETRTDPNGQLVYLCESLIESDVMHRIVTSELHVKDKQVHEFHRLSMFRISPAETAMKLERPEFVTVYEIMNDAGPIKQFLDDKYVGALKRDTEIGRLYLNFNEHNNHLNGTLYRLNDDVKGMLYITDERQLVIATYSLAQIHRLEKELHAMPFSNELIPIAKYEFKEDVFYDFVKNETGDFILFVEYLCDFDPEFDPEED
ncbi:MAG: hypothetical protein LBU41_03790 [Clostridiales Family XIII bacterium]|nr:hypothetical protein [Clostridiales Family XIII bacterium]